MTREILFKAVSIDGKWVEGDLVTLYYPVVQKHIACKGNNQNWCETEFVEILPDTVCQFTGELDINSKKIFESDRAKHKYCTAFYTCVFSKGRFYWQCEVTNDISPMATESELIGNIYDDKQLHRYLTEREIKEGKAGG